MKARAFPDYWATFQRFSDWLYRDQNMQKFLAGVLCVAVVILVGKIVVYTVSVMAH